MFKKTIVVSLLFLMILSGVIYPLRAHALFGIIDLDMDVPQLLRDIVDFIIDTIFETLKQRLLDTMTNQIIEWISGGGEPRFVSDFGGTLGDAFDAAVGDTVIELGYSELCYSPMQFKLKMQLTQPVFRNQVSCTLDDVVGNIAAFKNNFTNGGWIAYQETLKPQNNPAGLELLTQQEFLRRVSDKENVARYEATIGSGFLGQKRCIKWVATIDVEGMEESGLAVPSAYGNLGSSVSVGDDNWKPEFYTKTPLGIEYVGKTDTPGTGEWRCTNSETVTPGKVAADSITKLMIDSPIEKIISADQLSQYLGAIINAGINRLFKEGGEFLSKGLANMTKTTGEETCEDFEDEGLKAACYSSKAASNAKEALNEKGWDRLEKESKEEAEYFEDVKNIPGSDGVATTTAGFIEDSRNNLGSTRDNLIDVLSESEGSGDQLELASSTLTEVENLNNNDIDILNGISEDNVITLGLIEQCENKLASAETATTTAELTQLLFEATTTLKLAEDDKILIDNLQSGIDNYDDQIDTMRSQINSAYDYDISHVTSTLAEGKQYKLQILSNEVYELADDIETLPNKVSSIKARVEERHEKLENEFGKCTES